MVVLFLFKYANRRFNPVSEEKKTGGFVARFDDDRRLFKAERIHDRYMCLYVCVYVGTIFSFFSEYMYV